MTLWSHIIPFGESGWTLPLAASITLSLVFGGQFRYALLWLLSFGCGIALIVAGKIAFDFGGWSLSSIDFYSVSGHAMQTTALYPLLLALIGSAFSQRAARLGLYVGLAGALLMAVTLVAGDYHTLSETLGGAVIGLAVVFVYIKWQPRLRPVHIALLGAIPLVVALGDLHGVVRPARAVLWERAAKWLGATEQYTRLIHTDPAVGGQQVLVLRRRLL